VLRPSVCGAIAWAGLGLLALNGIPCRWPNLRVDWPAILVSLMVVLTPLVSITIPLAVHTVRQRGKLVAEYFSETCRLKVFCIVAVASLLATIVSVVCFRVATEEPPPAWLLAAAPAAAIGLTVNSVLGLLYILLETLHCTGPDARASAPPQPPRGTLAHSYSVVNTKGLF